MISTPKVNQAAGNTLRQARAAANLSLRELAARAHTSHATIAAYENGHKSPTVNTLWRILEAAGFGVDLVLSQRIREKNGLPRGEELRQALVLAAQFPVRHSAEIEYPRIGKRPLARSKKGTL